MKILLFHGRGMISRLIRCQTRGKYSHAALMLRDGSIIEAWQGDGVRQLPELRRGWDGIDCYRLRFNITETLESKLEWQAQLFIGRPYDYLGVLRFVTKRAKGDLCRLFCSELVIETFNLCGYPLLHAPGWAVSPDQIAWSPLLIKEEK